MTVLELRLFITHPPYRTLKDDTGRGRPKSITQLLQVRVRIDLLCTSLRQEVVCSQLAEPLYNHILRSGIPIMIMSN